MPNDVNESLPPDKGRAGRNSYPSGDNEKENVCKKGFILLMVLEYIRNVTEI